MTLDPKWRMRVTYDGRPFLGWQRQEQGMTVQEGLETALGVVLRSPVACEAAGRTDTGVHARGQVVHFRAPSTLEPFRVLRSINALVPDGIAVRDLSLAPEDFSARYSARWREYCYRLRHENDPLATPNGWRPRQKWNPDRVAQALEWFVGKHDFKAFCVPRDDGRHTLCELLLTKAVETPDGLELWIRGNRFLHRMVRSIVGFCLDASKGNLTQEDLERTFRGERTEPRFWAPPDGLTLERVGYEDWTEPATRGQPE